jgi:hypothetical protein
MATFNEQVLRAWDEWEGSTAADANDPGDFIEWALANKKLPAPIQDIKRILRRQVTDALRQVVRRDENGITYRAKQCVLISENGAQMALWFDVDRGGTRRLRQKAVHQRRERIADSVYRAVCDRDHMNYAFPTDPQIQFVLDFGDDVAERRARDAQFDEDDETDAA